MQDMVNIRTYKYISQEKISGWGRAVPKFKGNTSVLSNVTGCGCLTAICYRNISAFRIL